MIRSGSPLSRRLPQASALEIVDGASWNCDYSKLNLPAWYRNREPFREKVTYISLRHETAVQIRAICVRGWVTPSEEASLLGYPRCCVEDDHHKKLVMEEIFFRALMKAANENEEQARDIFLADTKVAIEGDDAARAEEAMELRRACPFTSVFMCASCAANERSPANRLSAQYTKLAKDLDLALFRTLEKSALMLRAEGRSPFDLEEEELAAPRLK
jgi:hypothetical protein